LSLEIVNARRANWRSVNLLPVISERVSSIVCIRRKPNCPMASTMAIRTANATPNLSGMCLIVNSKSE